MIRLAIAALVGAAGCLPDHYECKHDSDCDVGAGGRCEPDHHCTQFDKNCLQTLRRYDDHSGALSNVCYDDRVEPLDYCAAGQAPALPTGCAATVCAALPTCCATGWSETCAVNAQMRCPEIKCDTRIAITATRGLKTELWDLRFDGSAWSANARTDRDTLLAYLAPAPGDTEPRLAGLVLGPTLVVEAPSGQQTFELPIGRDYHDLQSLDLDRDGRDTIVLDWQDQSTLAQFVELVKFDDGTSRDVETGVSQREAWGDDDHDGFPDGVAAAGTRYDLLDSIDTTDHTRTLDPSNGSNVTGLATPGSPSIRGFVWSDIDADGQLDLVAYGNSLRIHAGEDRISNTALVTLDCDPPEVVGSPTCNNTVGSDTASWIANVIPTGYGGNVIAASYPTRALYRVIISEQPTTVGAYQLALPNNVACPSCAYLAIVVRDLDGDHIPDFVAIDTQLDLLVALSKNMMKLEEQRPIAPVNAPFTVVRVSVSGAPR